MHSIKQKIERDGFDLVGRRGKADIVEGAAAVRLVLEGELVIGYGARATRQASGLKSACCTAWMIWERDGMGKGCQSARTFASIF